MKRPFAKNFISLIYYEFHCVSSELRFHYVNITNITVKVACNRKEQRVIKLVLQTVMYLIRYFQGVKCKGT